MHNNQTSFSKQVGAQITAILLAAGAAAIFTFFQSLASQTGICATPSLDPIETSSLAAFLKTIHSTFLLSSGTMRG